MAGLLDVEDKLREPKKALEFGMGNQMPGILGLALLNQARRTIPAAYQAFTAPGRAYAGQIDPEDMLSEAQNLASMVTLGSGAIPSQANALRMGAGIPKGETSKFWHPASGIKLQQPVSEMKFDFAPGGLLAPAKNVDLSKLKGEVLVPAFGDRTIADATISSINDQKLTSPVYSQGGADFMRYLEGKAGWASEPSAMNTKAKYVADIGRKLDREPILGYTAMGAQAGDFSRHMADAVMGQITPDAKKIIDPKAVKKYDAFVKSKIDKKWPGLLDPEAKDYIPQMTGSNRRLLWQEMDKGEYRAAGMPDIGVTRLAITEPRLRDVDPFATGLTFGQTRASSQVVPTDPSLHATYGARLPAEYIGGLPESVPGEMIWRDFFGGRRAAGQSPASDQRSFMMTPSINQVVDQKMIDEVSRYLEMQAAKGLR